MRIFSTAKKQQINIIFMTFKKKKCLCINIYWQTTFTKSWDRQRSRVFAFFKEKCARLLPKSGGLACVWLFTKTGKVLLLKQELIKSVKISTKKLFTSFHQLRWYLVFSHSPLYIKCTFLVSVHWFKLFQQKKKAIY